MGVRNIPTFQDGQGHILFTLQLEGTLYYVYMDLNARDEHWYITIHDSSNVAIEGCVSRKIVTNWKILIGATVPTRPPGEIYTNSVDHVDPGLLDLGVRVALYYVEST